MSDHGIVTEAGAVRFVRRLAAPPELVWEYLVDAELRGRWFAAGPMEARPGGALILVFHNGALAPDDEEVPEKFRKYEGFESRGEVVVAEPPRRLVFLWYEESDPPTEVAFELEPAGEETLLTLTHRRLPSRAAMIDVAGGWHLHLDVLEDVLAKRPPRPFWARQAKLEKEYGRRIPTG